MTILELWEQLRRHLALTITLPVACVIACAVFCWGFMPNQYTAEASIYALSKSSESTGTVATNEQLNASQMLANDFTELLKNKQIQNEAASALGLQTLSNYDIRVNSSNTTRVLKVSVTGEDPDSCAIVANKLTEVVENTAVRVMNVEAINVISDAQAPMSPSGPPRLLYTAVAFLVGLFLAVAIVVIKELTDTTIRTEEDVRDVLGVSIIGRYPFIKEGSR